jgi:hypothetical protein
MSDYLKDPDTGMSISEALYAELFRSVSAEDEQRIAETIDDATVVVESLKKAIESDKE